MFTAQKQLWQHFQIFCLFCLRWQFSFRKHSVSNCLRGCQQRGRGTVLVYWLRWFRAISQKYLQSKQTSPPACDSCDTGFPSSRPAVSVSLSVAAGAASFLLCLCMSLCFPQFSQFAPHSLWMANWPVPPPPPLLSTPPHLSQGLCFMSSLADTQRCTALLEISGLKF